MNLLLTPSLRLLRLFALLLSGARLLAQVTAPAAPPASEDHVTLSPFTVTADADNGYVSTETLSGTRLRASVKDVASAMTIVTPDFMNDIGALTYEDVVNFMPSSASYATNDPGQQDARVLPHARFFKPQGPLGRTTARPERLGRSYDAAVDGAGRWDGQ